MPVPPVCDASPPVGSGLKLLLVTVAKKLSHAAIVALGYTTLDCVTPLPTKISLWPGSTGAASDATSPPATDTLPELFVTRPVVFDPNTNSRTNTSAGVGWVSDGAG